MAADVWNLRKDVKMTAQVVNDLKAEFEAYKKDVDDRDAARVVKITALGEAVDALKAKIDALPLPEVSLADVQSVLDDVKAAHAALTPAT